jgi:predicted ATPase/DNA-binding CsgD family transcriptional regulator
LLLFPQKNCLRKSRFHVKIFESFINFEAFIMPTPNKSPLLEPLTDRETDILLLLSEGRTNPEIADKLNLAVGTVQWYTKQIYKKLNVKNRTQAVVWATELGLISRVTDKLAQPYHNLPVYDSSFVGRDADLKIIKDLLGDDKIRLITIAGYGGIGKTRLSVEAARLALDQFTDGVYFVPLSTAATPGEIYPIIANLIGAPVSNVHLAADLDKRKLLLILDNFEHLLTGTQQIAKLLKGASAVKLLVTSRVALNLQGEYAHYLAGVAYPQNAGAAIENYGAVQLFVDRARRIKQDFALEAQRQAVVEICKAVDGQPLAIEMAASWLRGLSCAVIAHKINQDMLHFLRHRDGDIDIRHSSLRVVLDYSWQLLTGLEQRVLRRLSMFRGEFSYAAAEQVAGVNHEVMASLVDKSFLQQTTSGVYRFHNLLRQYAERQLEALELKDDQMATQSCLVLMLSLLVKGEFDKVMKVGEFILKRPDKESSGFETGIGTALLGVLSGIQGDYKQCKQFCKASHDAVYHNGKPKDTVSALFVHLGLAIAACGEGDYHAVKQHIWDALNIGKNLHVLGFSTLFLPLAAIVRAQDEQPEKAIEYMSLAFSHKNNSSQWMEQWLILTQLRDALQGAIGTTNFNNAWQRGSLLNEQVVVQEILRDFDDYQYASA